ncbi:histidinol phosphatase [Antarcticibacterium arcticum]|uniref:protein-tyrosine-phosphatase n=1 Tax=Antarcticibacterium arcticum TaxID=2585771 RepID=A0A5B8YF60_9FLAO|nr:CpsB/CapC family capsule biosynthesis tyrosine phosphatase [Antarcticibacterium arcticum]QED36545.1 histidinol phosphatase [Antarcticibacterium arcticum]
MISIFQKKEFLIDKLQGITDIHNHILPGIDDGAAGIEDSIQLIRRFHSRGISNFICTPHIMNDYYPNTPESIHNALEKVKEALQANPLLKEIKIKAAAEYMMDQSFLELLEKNELLTLKDKYVLVEMSYFQAPINLKEILFKLQTHGYKPVLAHPERYAYYHSKDLRKYEELRNRGCLMQINALSLSPHYGTNMQAIGSKLLEAGMIDFIGSDTHREQHIDKLEMIKLNKRISAELQKVIDKTKAFFKI